MDFRNAGAASLLIEAAENKEGRKIDSETTTRLMGHRETYYSLVQKHLTERVTPRDATEFKTMNFETRTQPLTATPFQFTGRIRSFRHSNARILRMPAGFGLRELRVISAKDDAS